VVLILLLLLLLLLGQRCRWRHPASGERALVTADRRWRPPHGAPGASEHGCVVSVCLCVCVWGGGLGLAVGVATSISNSSSCNWIGTATHNVPHSSGGVRNDVALAVR
jgi:hypothetical protein